MADKRKQQRSQRRARNFTPDDALLAQVSAEIETLKAAGRIWRFKPEKRCRVCSQTNIVGIVNKLLAMGETYNNILKDIEPYQKDLPPNKRISYDSLRNHYKKHFAEDDAAAMVHRRILEENARKQEIDFIEGTATALTPLAFMESVLQKSYDTVVSKETFITPEMGMKAAENLYKIQKSEQGNKEIEEIVYKTNRLIEIVREVVPVKYWEEISNRLADEEAGSAPGTTVSGDIVDDFDDAELDDDDDVVEIVEDDDVAELERDIPVGDVIDQINSMDFDVEGDV